MFSRSQRSFSKNQKPSKSTNSFTKSNASFSKESGVSKSRRHDSRRRPPTVSSATALAAFADQAPSPVPHLTSAIVTLVVGREQRIFAAHEDILAASPYFQSVMQTQIQNQMMFYPQFSPVSPVSLGSPGSPGSPGGAANNKRIALPDDEPEIFSSVLEYLYKGDYYPRLLHNKRRDSWELEQPSHDDGAPDTTIFYHGLHGELLKDTIIYCTADKYGLTELKRIALRKQGLQSGIQCSTILSSARYAYANTPDTDSKLRAHYLALIIRSRNTFKRSGTMQLEMFNGGSQLFFDLFVALCNHVDDIATAQSSPRSNHRF